jgi:hypothetical protein
MAKLPTYEQQTVPNLIGTRPMRQPAVIHDPTGRGLEVVGAQTERLAMSLNQRNLEIQRQDDQKALLDADLQFATATADLGRLLDESKTASPEDPTGFTPRFMDQVGEYRDKLVGQTTNPKAQDALRLKFAHLGTHLDAQARHFEADQGARFRGARIENATGKFATYLANDDSAFEPIWNEMQGMVDRSNLPPALREQYRDKITASLTAAAGAGFALKFPRIAQELVDKRLGIEAPPRPKPSDTPPPDLTSEAQQAWLKVPARERAAFTEVWRANREGRFLNVQVGPAQQAAAMSASMVDVQSPGPVPPDIVVNVEKTLGVPWLDRMDARQLLAYKTHVDALVHKDQADAQSALRAAYHTAGAQAERGVVPNQPPADLVNRAVGPERAQEEAAKFADLQRFASSIAHVSTMTAAEMVQAATALAPIDKNDPQWLPKTKAAEEVLKAGSTVLKARKDDTMAAARDQKIATINPINWQDPAQASAELASRQGVALNMVGRYGSTSYSVLTNDEAKAYGENWHRLKTTQQAAVLGPLRTALTNSRVFQSTVAAFSQDSPSTMAAADLVTRSAAYRAPDGTSAYDVGLGILEGERLLHPDRFAKKEDGAGKPYTLPPTGGANGMDAALAKMLGPAFMENAEWFARAKQGVYAYYAHLSARAGSYSEPAYDSGRLEAATDAVLGARSKWARGWFTKNQTILMPWGMPEDEFKRRLPIAVEAALTAAGMKDANSRDMELISVDEYTYGLRLGGKKIADRNGQAVVVDLTSLEGAP